MSECAGAYSMSYSEAWQTGSVGRPLPGTEARISDVTGDF
jgi:long-subunit acyl-CoA synthetase (AMP-forming)